MEYLLKSTAILSIFYVFYKMFLQNETFFKSIRIYFLVGFISAVVVPFIIIPKYITINPLVVPANVISQDLSQTVQNNVIDWPQIIFLIYFIGVVVLTIRFFVQLSSLIWFLYKHPKTQNGKYFMVKTDKNNAPFSFFNYIVYNPNQFKGLELKQIIWHEKIHVNQWHSIDTIISQFVVILNWFNPLIWLFDKEIQKNLEFIADEFAHQLTNEKKQYQYLLLKTISPNYPMALTSNFYNSIIKKRINMLHKNRSNKTMYLKFALILPMLIAFIFTFNTEMIAQQKVVKTMEIHEDANVEIISKDFTKIQLEQLKTRLAAKGITFKYKKLKYNSQNEIIAIHLTVSNNKGSEANIAQKSTEAIQPIQIKVDNKTGAIALGNIQNLHTSDMFFTSKSSGVHKKILIKKGGDDQNIFVIAGDSTKIVQSGDGNKLVIISEDDGDGESTFVVKSEIVKVDDYDENIKVWVSKNGNEAASKKFKIVRIDGDDDIIVGSEGGIKHKVIVRRIDSDNENMDILIETDSKPKGNHSKMLFIDSDGKKPLFFVDGKEIKDGNLDDIDPDTINNINILKGKVAIDKYGAKAKDGVILIETKK